MAVWPCVGKARLLKESGMFLQAVSKRVEVLKESIDGVIPAVTSLALAYGHDTLWSREGATWCIEVFVGEDENGLARPVTALGNAKEIVFAHTGFSPSHSQEWLVR